MSRGQHLSILFQSSFSFLPISDVFTSLIVLSLCIRCARREGDGQKNKSGVRQKGERKGPIVATHVHDLVLKVRVLPVVCFGV